MSTKKINHHYSIKNSQITQKDILKLNKSVFVLAFLSVLLGGFIYLLWRPDTIRVFSWLDFVGLSAPIQFIRNYSKIIHPFIPDWIIFSLPNGLWVFSYALIVSHMWLGHHSSIKYLWLISILVVGLGYEVLQYLNVISGTFCCQDLLLGILGVSAGTALSVLVKMKAESEVEH